MMKIINLIHIKWFRLSTTLILILSLTQGSFAASFVLGKQYLLKPKRQNTSLVWYAVTFDKSITGGLKLTLKVFSDKGKSLEFLDDYQSFVSPEIAKRCISKFSMTDYRMVFNADKRSTLGFQTNSISEVMYVPLKVKYENGFEDYLVRIRINGGKFAISSRPLQHGMLTIPDPNAVENYKAELEKQKQDKIKQEEAKKSQLEQEKKKQAAKLQAEEEAKRKAAPSVIINQELFDTDSTNVDELLKESENEFNKKEAQAKEKIRPIETDEDLYKQPLQTPTELMPKTEEQEKPSTTIPLNQPDVKDGFDALFDGSIEQSNEGKPKGSIYDSSDDDDSAPLSPIMPEELKKEEPKFVPEEEDNNELEIEGFDDALLEIERLEKLESQGN